MKRIMFTTVACSLLLAAGCAHKEKQAKFESKTPPPSYITGTDTTYNPNYNVSTTTAPSESSSPQVNTTINQSTAQTQIEPAAGDSALISQVRAALNNDTTLVTVAPAIQVTAQNGTVTLSGNVANDQQKQTIEHLVKGTSGVVTVNNQLQISPSATGGSSQSSIYSNSTSQVQGSVSSSTPATSTEVNQSGTKDSALSATSDKSSSRLYSTKDDFQKDKSSTSVGASGEASLGSTNSASGSFSTQSTTPTTPSATTTTPSTTPSSDTSSSTSLSSTNQSTSTVGTSPTETKSTSGLGASGEASLGATNSATGSFSTGTSSSSSSSTSPPQSSIGTSTAGSLGTTNTSGSVSTATSGSVSTGENKDLSATSERPSPRVYSTNSAGNSSSPSGQASGTDSLNIRVLGSSEADQKLADQLRQELKSNTALAGATSQLRISLQNGKATLRGTVKTDAEKQQVEQAIQKVTGVTSVQNDLRVSATGAASQTDQSK